MIGVQARIICSACPGENLPQNQKPSYRRYRRLKNPDYDVIIIHNVGERRAIYCAPHKASITIKFINVIVYDMLLFGLSSWNANYYRVPHVPWPIVPQS